MESLDEWFAFALGHDVTVTFGNLGRMPDTVFDYLKTKSLSVVLTSPFYRFRTSADNRVRFVPLSGISMVRCDLLVYAEPVPNQPVQKPSGVARMAVLASHLKFPSVPRAVYASHFYPLVPNPTQTVKSLLERKDATMTARNASQLAIDFVRVLPVGHSQWHPEKLDRPTYVVIDLTGYASPVKAFLAYLDAFDYAIDNADHVARWLVCFADVESMQAFDQFGQETIDALFCKRFEYGNASRTTRLLSLLPFYKYGVSDERKAIRSETFVNMPYVAPDTVAELYETCVGVNLEHVVGSVYRIKDADGR